MEMQIKEVGKSNNGNRFLKRVYAVYVGLGNIRLQFSSQK